MEDGCVGVWRTVEQVATCGGINLGVCSHERGSVFPGNVLKC